MAISNGEDLEDRPDMLDITCMRFSKIKKLRSAHSNLYFESLSRIHSLRYRRGVLLSVVQESKLLSRNHPLGNHKLNSCTDGRCNKSGILPSVHRLLTVGLDRRLPVRLHGLHVHRLSAIRVLNHGCDRCDHRLLLCLH